MVKESTTGHHPTQRKSFEEAARALECDESEERFDAALKKIATHKPPKDREAGAPEAKAPGQAKKPAEPRQRVRFRGS